MPMLWECQGPYTRVLSGSLWKELGMPPSQACLPFLCQECPLPCHLMLTPCFFRSLFKVSPYQGSLTDPQVKYYYSSHHSLCFCHSSGSPASCKNPAFPYETKAHRAWRESRAFCLLQYPHPQGW